MILVSKEAAPTQEPVVAEDHVLEEVDLPRTTTGVIRIMRAKGRPEMADLVEELHNTHLSVQETTELAKDLLKLLRTLQRKATGVHNTVKPREPAGDDI